MAPTKVSLGICRIDAMLSVHGATAPIATTCVKKKSSRKWVGDTAFAECFVASIVK